MKDWIPLFQSLVWPIFVAALLIWLRRGVAQVIVSINERIKSGASFKAGPTGIELGGRQEPPSAARTMLVAKSRAPQEQPHTIYMTHQAARDPSLDRGALNYYRVKIWLDADEPGMLADVEKVTYHLHPTFPDPDRTSTDPKSRFAIATAAWGEFNMSAEIFFRGNKPKLVVERYINFPAT